MDNKSNSAGSHELKFSREQGFFDRSPTIRILIGLLFALALFLFLHFREVRVEVLELNSIAKSFIVTQVDFDFIDEEATAIMKQEAVRDVGRIYRISSKEIRQRHTEFDNFLLYNQDWQKYAEDTTFEEIYTAVDSLEKALQRLRFSDPRTLQKMKEIGVSTTDYQIYTPAELTEPIVVPEHIWKVLKENGLPTSKIQDATSELILGFFRNQPWLIEEDIPAERQLRRRIQGLVPEKITYVSAGSRIIDQGERVTARHIAMLQAMKQALNESRNLWHPLTIIGGLILSLLLTGICIAYLSTNHPLILVSNRKLFLIVTVVILTMILAKATEFFLLASKNNAIEIVRYPIFIAFAAILICSLMNPSIATFISGFLTFVLTLSLAFDMQGFMIINIVAALVAILNTHSLRRRKEIFVVCSKAWIACVVAIFALNFSQNVAWNFSIVIDILSSAVCMLMTAILVVGLLPLLESAFRVMTDVTLTEYMDPNNDLLRRLTIEAPGTYQHSVVVGNVAEAAAVAIGANGLFCRVATLYHDIGKIATPQYFTENQQGSMNIHQLLTPEESAQVIINHVREGVSIARKAGLPEQFIDIIKEHHGTTLVYYFYRKALESVNGDASKIDEKAFRYSGPKPRSKESAIIMISDSVEAAARSLEKVSEDSLNELASRLIRDKADDGQFDECKLTLEELAVVKATLVKTLVAYGHARIKYPTRSLRPPTISETPVPNIEA
jgi:putative nucleotidyltransferase with HDIG domain